jgi:hypothetical protein
VSCPPSYPNQLTSFKTPCHPICSATRLVGLLLARWLLEHVGVLADHLVIPLDAHLGWFAPAKSANEPANAKRADLLLVGLRPAERVVRFGLVTDGCRRFRTTPDHAPHWSIPKILAWMGDGFVLNLRRVD